jgi:hypothetical protein
MVGGGMMNRNEGRNMFDLSPVDGLNEFVVLENYIPVQDVGNQKKLNNNGSAPDDEGDDLKGGEGKGENGAT